VGKEEGGFDQCTPKSRPSSTHFWGVREYTHRRLHIRKRADQEKGWAQKEKIWGLGKKGERGEENVHTKRAFQVFQKKTKRNERSQEP